MRANLQRANACKYIKLRDVLRTEAIDLVRVVDDIEIEPSTLSPAASGGTPLVTHTLELVTDLTFQIRRERSRTNSSSVCLDNTNGCLNGLGRHTKTRAHATDCCGR